MPSRFADDALTTADRVVTFQTPRAHAPGVRATALVFEDPRSIVLQERVHKLAQSDATVLIVGETGTGKELIARQLHRLSPRREASFVAVNCAALAEHLVESELFGHERGAFTGAVSQRKGWFEAASGGTLFLDEVAELPPATQVKILRAVQEREIIRVGSTTPIPVDVRFIAATNIDLEGAVRAGRFREDLYYRLNVAKLPLAPLRERPGDIMPLVTYFLGLYRERLGIAAASISNEARAALLCYSWPGNIRELENVVHHALLVMRDSIIRPQDLNLSGYRAFTPALSSNHGAGHGCGDDLTRALNTMFAAGGPKLYATIEQTVVQAAYVHCRKNQVRTASLLGISRNILRHRLKLYGLI